MTKSSKIFRVKSIDALRTIAILSVVLIHTTTRVLEASHFDLNNYTFTLFLNQSFRFAAFLFFAISGFVLELNYDNHKSILSYIKSRFSKIFIPYMFWSLIYYAFVYTNISDGFVKVLLTGEASYQLYFIPTLLIFYLMFPLLHKMKHFLTNKLFLLALFISQALLLNHDYFVKPFPTSLPIRIVILCFFSFSMGISVSHYKNSIIKFVEKTKYFLVSIMGFSAFYIFNEGKTRYLETLNYLDFYSSWRVDILIYTIIVGALLFYLFEKPNFQHSILEKISNLSFFIFFIHVIVLEMVWKYFGNYVFSLTRGNTFAKILFDPLFFLTVTGLSLFIGYLVHKIPKLAKITG